MLCVETNTSGRYLFCPNFLKPCYIFHFQGGLSGLAGKFPPSYMGAVVQGQALGGIFAAASNVAMLAVGEGAVTAAFADFLIAVIFLVTALIAFIILTRTEFYQYYANESTKTKEDQSEKGKNWRT